MDEGCIKFKMYKNAKALSNAIRKIDIPNMKTFLSTDTGNYFVV